MRKTEQRRVAPESVTHIQWHEDWNVYRMLDRLKGAGMSGLCKCIEEHLQYSATKESIRVCVGVAGEWDALVSLRY